MSLGIGGNPEAQELVGTLLYWNPFNSQAPQSILCLVHLSAVNSWISVQR